MTNTGAMVLPQNAVMIQKEEMRYVEGGKVGWPDLVIWGLQMGAKGKKKNGNTFLCKNYKNW